jgi:large subunit ribosomal protein L18
VFRSSQHIYAQVIDDVRGHTVAAASTLDKDLRETLKSGADTQAAAQVGRLLAERAKAAGIEQVVFDRGAYIYHGRVQSAGGGRPRGWPGFLT